ncbi:MAG TPA: histidine kinase dimerization/phospho-acceptor domain-containing protein [Pyrinomonadaceae bacterium]|nr:histidine kinase dimerization/phospho-acceptor domain-containing protein [Pyrinomonadaceae bacterium]
MEPFDSGSGTAPKLEDDSRNSSIELEKINADLTEQNRHLRELAERRAASLAHLAHELRTPLTSILGFSEILLGQEKLTDAQRNFCQRIQNSAHQLQNSLTKLSELSRVETQRDEDPAD